MTNNNNQISATEAKAALESLDNINQKSLKVSRPPLWVNLLASFFLGVETFAASLSSGNSLWTMITLVSTAGLILTMLLWYMQLSAWGIKNRVIPKRFTSKLFSLAQGLLVALLIIGSIALYKQGFTWIPYIAGSINAVLLSYILYHYPNGEWVARESGQ